MEFILKRDGELANLADLEDLGFRQNLKNPRDFRTDSDGKVRFNFVGFVSNETGDLLVVMPKHFKPVDPPADLSRLFQLITREISGTTNRYFGSENSPIYVADYPFAAFYAIYEHYKRWGLVTHIDRQFRTSPPGRANWRKTIQRGSWFPSRSGPIPFPVVYDTGRQIATFLSECTVFAIDYTLERFGFLLGLDSTGVTRPNFDLGLHREYIVETLRSLREQTFRDSTLTLIDALIDFFGADHAGGGFYFKQYSFHLLWEKIVLSYLNRHFAGFGPDGEVQLRLQPRDATGVEFAKQRFHLNAAKTKQVLEPDYYATNVDGKSQYILDAKYYSKVTELNYKQLSYTMLLDSLLGEDGHRRFEHTYSTLLLPAQTPRTDVHFVADPQRSGLRRELKIIEQYLDIREIVEDYFRG